LRVSLEQALNLILLWVFGDQPDLDSQYLQVEYLYWATESGIPGIIAVEQKLFYILQQSLISEQFHVVKPRHFFSLLSFFFFFCGTGV
jgi:hypothetical protein